jgi:hypothetical protein
MSSLLLPPPLLRLYQHQKLPSGGNNNDTTSSYHHHNNNCQENDWSNVTSLPLSENLDAIVVVADEDRMERETGAARWPPPSFYSSLDSRDISAHPFSFVFLGELSLGFA